MKSHMLVAAAALALIAGHLGAGNCLAGEIAPGSLTKMGLAGVKKMSDREGKQVRGTGSAAVSGGFSFAANNHSFSFGTTIATHSMTATSASASSTSIVFVH